MVAPALAMASDVPPMAKLPRSTGSAGSAGGIVLSATATFFPTRQRVIAKYFCSLNNVLRYHSSMNKCTLPFQYGYGALQKNQFF